MYPEIPIHFGSLYPRSPGILSSPNPEVPRGTLPSRSSLLHVVSGMNRMHEVPNATLLTTRNENLRPGLLLTSIPAVLCIVPRMLWDRSWCTVARTQEMRWSMRRGRFRVLWRGVRHGGEEKFRAFRLSLFLSYLFRRSGYVRDLRALMIS